MSPRTQLLSAIAASAVVVLVAVVIVRQEMLKTLREEALSQHDATERLTKKLTVLDARIGALETAPAPEVSGLDTLRTELETIKETIVSQETKLNTLNEKTAVLVNAPSAPVETTAPIKPTADSDTLLTAVNSGNSYAAELAAWDKNHPGKESALPSLRRTAGTGLPSETTLQNQFHDIVRSLETAQPQPDESKLVQRLNTHLAGLISIKKTTQTTNDYATLRALGNAPLSTLAAQVDALPGTAQAPFLLWRDTVRNRVAVQTELSTLTAGTL